MLITVQQNRSGLVHRLVHTICQTFLTYEASKNIPPDTVSRQLNVHVFILVFERAVKYYLRLHIQIKYLPSHQMPFIDIVTCIVQHHYGQCVMCTTLSHNQSRLTNGSLLYPAKTTRPGPAACLTTVNSLWY